MRVLEVLDGDLGVQVELDPQALMQARATGRYGVVPSGCHYGANTQFGGAWRHSEIFSVARAAELPTAKRSKLRF